MQTKTTTLPIAPVPASGEVEYQEPCNCPSPETEHHPLCFRSAATPPASEEEVERLVQPEAAAAKHIATAVMRWGTPHFKHMVSFNTLCEAIEIALAALSSPPSGERGKLVEEWKRLEDAFHDAIADQGDPGDGGAAGRLLCQFVYDNGDKIRAHLTSMSAEIKGLNARIEKLGGGIQRLFNYGVAQHGRAEELSCAKEAAEARVKALEEAGHAMMKWANNICRAHQITAEQSAVVAFAAALRPSKQEGEGR